jgi:hypothetical protein
MKYRRSNDESFWSSKFVRDLFPWRKALAQTFCVQHLLDFDGRPVAERRRDVYYPRPDATS